jgi:hypothetical protein
MALVSPIKIRYKGYNEGDKMKNKKITYLPGPWLLCAATASPRRGTIELSDIKKIY